MERGGDIVLFEEQNYNTASAPSYWAEKGKAFIANNYSSIRGIQEICSELGISSSYFREVFYFSYNVNPKAYLDSVRISAAKRLLSKKVSLRENTTLCHVAKFVGFKNACTFRRTFKRISGVSIADFLKGITVRRLPVKMIYADDSSHLEPTW